MNNLKLWSLAGLMIIVAFTIGRFTAPASVSTKTAEHTVTDVDQNTNRNQDIVVTTKETKLPDGTVIKETRKEKDTQTQTETKSKLDTSKTASTLVVTRPSYRIGILYEPAIMGLQKVSGTAIVERRLFSELYLGVSASSNHTLGVVISLGF